MVQSIDSQRILEAEKELVLSKLRDAQELAVSLPGAPMRFGGSSSRLAGVENLRPQEPKRIFNNLRPAQAVQEPNPNQIAAHRMISSIEAPVEGQDESDEFAISFSGNSNSRSPVVSSAASTITLPSAKPFEPAPGSSPDKINAYAAAYRSSPDGSSRYANMPVDDVAKAVGLNERFLFVREIFGGSMQRFLDAVALINLCPDFDDAAQEMSKMGVDVERECGQKFVQSVMRRFNS